MTAGWGETEVPMEVSSRRLALNVIKRNLSLVWVGTLAGCPYPSGLPFPLTRGHLLGFTRSVLVVASHLSL